MNLHGEPQTPYRPPGRSRHAASAEARKEARVQRAAQGVATLLVIGCEDAELIARTAVALADLEDELQRLKAEAARRRPRRPRRRQQDRPAHADRRLLSKVGELIRERGGRER